MRSGSEINEPTPAGELLEGVGPESQGQDSRSR